MQVHLSDGFGRLENIRVVNKGMETVDVVRIDQGNLAVYHEGQLRLCRRRRYRVCISEVLVRFEGQLHIPLIVRIAHITIEVMLCDKPPEGAIAVLLLMFLYVHHEHRDLEQLVALCGVTQIDRE